MAFVISLFLTRVNERCFIKHSAWIDLIFNTHTATLFKQCLLADFETSFDALNKINLIYRFEKRNLVDIHKSQTALALLVVERSFEGVHDATRLRPVAPFQYHAPHSLSCPPCPIATTQSSRISGKRKRLQLKGRFPVPEPSSYELLSFLLCV
jgi:hypothetical protein